MFGGKAVVDGDHAATGLNRQHATEGIVAFEIAAEEAAAVEIQDDRPAVLRRGAKLPRGYPAGQQEILHHRERRRRAGQRDAPTHHLPCLGYIKGRPGW